MYVLLTAFVGILTGRAGQNVVLEWDWDPDPDIQGYCVKYGPASGLYDRVIPVGLSTSATVVGLKHRQTYYIAVVAYDTWGIESLPSEEVVYSPSDSSEELFAPHKSEYSGAIMEGPGGRNVSISLHLTGTGAFTGRVLLENTKAKFRGRLGLDRRATVVFFGGGGLHILNVELNSSTGELEASIPSVDGEISLRLLPVASPDLGASSRYIMLLGHFYSAQSEGGGASLPPEGTSFARVEISRAGRVRTSGKLADGQPFTATSHLETGGSFNVHALPYKSPRGILAGRLQVPESGRSGSGYLWWFKPPQSKGTNRQGFEGTVTVGMSGLEKRPAKPHGDGPSQVTRVRRAR